MTLPHTFYIPTNTGEPDIMVKVYKEDVVGYSFGNRRVWEYYVEYPKDGATLTYDSVTDGAAIHTPDSPDVDGSDVLSSLGSFLSACDEIGHNETECDESDKWHEMAHSIADHITSHTMWWDMAE